MKRNNINFCFTKILEWEIAGHLEKNFYLTQESKKEHSETLEVYKLSYFFKSSLMKKLHACTP